MISHQYKFIFVHIPKTGGDGVSSLVGRFASPMRMLPEDDMWTEIHGKYFHFIEAYGKDTWDEYYKFTFIRNPWARLVSAFFYLDGGGNSIYDKMLSDKYIKKYESDFTRFVKDLPVSNMIESIFHLHPQHEFICDKEGRILVDFVGRFENIQEDFNKICDKFRTPHAPLPHLNKTQYAKKQHYSSYYNDETREIVADVYSRDIQLFGYTFEQQTTGKVQMVQVQGDIQEDKQEHHDGYHKHTHQEEPAATLKVGGKRELCACGKTKTPPYCDGSHEHMSEQEPVSTLKPGGKRELCACGKTKTPPYCDGSHEHMGQKEPEPTVKTEPKRELCACGKTKTPPYCDGSHEHISQQEPVATLKPGGKRELCACGKTKTPPYCDGSHEHMSEQEPVATLKPGGKRELCACGKTKTPPYCDGSHEHMSQPETLATLKPGGKRELCACGKTKTPPYCDGSHERQEEKTVPRPLERNYYDLYLKRMQRPSVKKSPIPNKIVLTLLPVWSPLIPPQGIAHLKNFLQKQGYKVEAIDANSEYRFKQLTDNYFAALKKHIPEYKLANINNIGNDVLRDHMMAHINYEDKEKYIELVKIIIYKTFYWEASDLLVYELLKALNEFYGVLGIYFADILEVENPEVFGVSAFRDTLATSLFVFRICKEKFPHIKTVMGGTVFSFPIPPGSPNFEFFLEKTRDYIDKMIIGRGEIAFLKYLRSIQRVENTQEIDKEISFSFASPEDRPDLSDFNLQRYHYHGAFGSTGCPNRCSFCNVESFFGPYKKKDPRQTAQEMIELNKKYGARLFFMLDELLNPIITDLTNEFIKQNVSLYWDGYFRIDSATSNIENTHLWRRGGFYRARIGIESGSQRILNLMNKGITIPQIKAALASLALAGIKTTLYVVIGHPGETEEDFQQTLDLIEELKDYTWEAECNPFTYFYTGQGKSGEWEKKRMLLFPEWATDMLITQTWIVDGVPSREEMFERVCRFTEHCKKLQIASPWSLVDIYKADQRWQTLHENAVPGLLEFQKENADIDENKHVKKLFIAQDDKDTEGDFHF